MRRVGVLVQARVSSLRLPGKVLKPILGKPLVLRLLQRLDACDEVQEVRVVTSTHPSDDALCDVLRLSKRRYFRGDLNDVLARYYQAALKSRLDVIVRVTGDCPLIDAPWVDRSIREFKKSKADALFCPNSVPYGFRFNILSFDALERAFKNATLPSEREHVVPYLWNHPALFKLRRYGYARRGPAYHLSVDYPRDLELVRAVYAELFPTDPLFTLEDVLALLGRDKKIRALNAGVRRVDGYQKSLAQDRVAAGTLS